MTISITRRTGLCLAFAVSGVLAQHAFAAEPEATETNDDVTELSDIEVTDSPLGSLGNEVSASAFGFSKPIVDTPRSVSFISTDQIDLFNVSSVNDLARLVPNVFTNQRRGYEGAINVRGVPSDTYYRGMKRLYMQGHTRTVLGSMDSIEIVKGPPSPIFGMGMIGGYTNMNPKAGRAKIGGYLDQSQGFSQVTVGSFQKNEFQLGVGGPAKVGAKEGGYYVFGLLEDSDQYTDRVTVQQKYLQASLSLDNFVGPFRLEVGTQYQHSQNKGAILTRVTQDVVDSGRYVKGTPLADLDVDGDGRIGYLEMHQASPVRGTVSAANQPLAQRFSWPTSSPGVYYKLGDFPDVPGIPQTMLDFLGAHPEVNCRAANVMRAMPAGGPLPQSGQLPVGFVLNPCDAGYAQVDYRANPTLERDQDGKILLGYVDLVYDVNPDFTVKNQIFFDGMDQHKIGDQPFAEFQEIYAVENKLTVTRRVPSDWLPTWATINSLASVNFRYNHMTRKTSGGDYDFRNDATLHMGQFYSNSTFWTPADDFSYGNGLPYTNINTTQFSETGFGLMFDVDLFTNTNFTLGGRYDYSKARNTDYAAFNFAAGTSANPGRYNTTNASADGSDNGLSYSASLSHKLPFGLRPYVTYAQSSLALVGSSQQLGNATIDGKSGHIGEAELKEAGIKGSWLNDRLFASVAYYEQSRYDVTEPDDPSFGAEVSSIETKGVEVEVKYTPIDNLFISAYAVFQEAEFLDLPVSANLNIDGRSLGFMDVFDPATGALLYPAEAFLYGGRPTLVMPGAIASEYGEITGNPETQYGMTAFYKLKNGIGFDLSGNWFSETYTSRLKNVELPEVFLVNAGVSYEVGKWNLKLTGFNMLNERWFRARNGYTTPDVLNPAPTRYWQLSARYSF